MKSAKTSALEILFIVAMFIPNILAGVFKIWPMFWMFTAFNVCFGLAELFYVKTTGMTVSQHFWKKSKDSKKDKVQAIILLVSMAIMWTALIVHLGYKMFL